jgi:hypothetical protein
MAQLETVDIDTFAAELLELLALAREEKLTISLYRFRDRGQIGLEAFPASDFRVQEEGELGDVVSQMSETIRAARAQVDEEPDGPRLARAVVALLDATEDQTVFINFLHPAGGEYSCQVEVVVPDPLTVLANVLAPDALEAIEGALEKLRAPVGA